MAAVVSVPFAVQRMGLIAGQLTPVVAPITCHRVTVSNLTAAALRVETTGNGSDRSYFDIPAQFEREILLSPTTLTPFRAQTISFWLRAESSGEAVLLWA